MLSFVEAFDVVKIINDDTRESAHRQKEGKFTTVRSKAVGISL